MSAPQPAGRPRRRSSERQVSRIFQALGDPTRRAVVERLSHGPASMTAIAQPFRMALPSFAQHMKVLEDCGIVRSHKAGRVRSYELDLRSLVSAEDWMAHQRAVWEQRLDRMEAVVAEMKRDGA
jgi:DNA-binding transcriptional ArsR family regulator